MLIEFKCNSNYKSTYHEYDYFTMYQIVFYFNNTNIEGDKKKTKKTSVKSATTHFLGIIDVTKSIGSN